LNLKLKGKSSNIVEGFLKSNDTIYTLLHDLGSKTYSVASIDTEHIIKDGIVKEKESDRIIACGNFLIKMERDPESERALKVEVMSF
jgi:hypothetical protein